MIDRPWWFPVLVNDSWVAIRRDYPEQTASLTDDEVKYHYAVIVPDGVKYYNSMLWDNLGDAVEAYEQLADAYLKLLKKDFAKEFDGGESNSPEF